MCYNFQLPEHTYREKVRGVGHASVEADTKWIWIPTRDIVLDSRRVDCPLIWGAKG